MAALLIGYARCSTDQQDLTAQHDGLTALGVSPARIYVDHGLTGTTRDRPGLREAMAACREGDTLVGASNAWRLAPASVSVAGRPARVITDRVSAEVQVEQSRCDMRSCESMPGVCYAPHASDTTMTKSGVALGH